MGGLNNATPIKPCDTGNDLYLTYNYYKKLFDMPVTLIVVLIVTVLDEMLTT